MSGPLLKEVVPVNLGQVVPETLKIEDTRSMKNELFAFLAEYADFPETLALSGISLQRRDMEADCGYVLGGVHGVAIRGNHSGYPELYLNGRPVWDEVCANGNYCPIRTVVLRERGSYYPDPDADVQVVFAAWNDLPDIWAFYSAERVEPIEGQTAIIEVY